MPRAESQGTRPALSRWRITPATDSSTGEICEPAAVPEALTPSHFAAESHVDMFVPVPANGNQEA